MPEDSSLAQQPASDSLPPVITSSLLLATALSFAPQQGPALAPALSSQERPPKIGGLRVDNHGGGEVTVSWATDEITRGYVVLNGGLTMADFHWDDVVGREHSVHIHGLEQNSAYAYVVQAIDLSSNRSTTGAQTLHTGGPVTGTGFRVSGDMRAWFPLTFDFEGPLANEFDDGPNPFLDYRLQVEFTSPDGLVMSIPGFFDGDGRGGGTGNVWRVRFAPYVEGSWSFVARFRSGSEVAVELSPQAGSPSHFDGMAGTFEVLPRDDEAPGFYKWGKLVYVNDHYLKFFDGSYFIKGGTNSPENLLAYQGFDNTVDQGGIDVSGLDRGLHLFEPHRADWGPAKYGGLGSHADPLFRSEDTQVDSRGIVGAINYLASVNVNSIYFLPMNLGGDGWDVCPFVGYANTRFNKTHYDVSKLRQWNSLLEHVARLGIASHVVLSETEPANENWLDGGRLEVERKLFFREMVARFGHLPAIKWNLAEECEYTTAEVFAFAAYMRDIDPYDHPVGFHVNLLPLDGSSQQYDDVLGDPRIATNSLQAVPHSADVIVEKWRNDSAAAGRKWVVEFDEQLQGLRDDNAVDLRKLQLWETLLSGGHIEWYTGYHELPLGGDLRLEDFRTRDEMWNYTWYARKLLEEHVPFWELEPHDDLIQGEASPFGDGQLFAKLGWYYVGYLSEARTRGTLDLTHTQKLFVARWYNPRTGEFEGPEMPIRGGEVLPIPHPPGDAGEDWAFLIVPAGI